MTRRILTGGAAAVATLLLLAGTALGGGWATITADAGAVGDQPLAGETDEFGFTVLQHGQTPASWVHATLVVENIATGRTMEIAATPQGADGHFVATVTFPESGYWSWRVDLTDLMVESPPRMLTVLTADGGLPAFDSTVAMTMIERAKGDLRSEFEAAYGQRVGSLETALTVVESRASNLERQRDALSQRLAVAESNAGDGGVPIGATLAVAILGGGMAGFVLTALGRRSGGPREDSSAVPEYAPSAR
ncbi:MAG: hypothetical protein M3R57_00100 [Chloroflexota bacterium]|nr:hypothetical protein [Chloroflexota bacterium]